MENLKKLFYCYFLDRVNPQKQDINTTKYVDVKRIVDEMMTPQINLSAPRIQHLKKVNIKSYVLKPVFALILLFLLTIGLFTFIAKNYSFFFFQKIQTQDIPRRFQITKNIQFLLGPHSQITMKKNTLHLTYGQLIGEYLKKNDPINKKYSIVVDNIRIQVIGTKFYLEHTKEKAVTIFVEHGHLRITPEGQKSIDLLSQSYATISNKKSETGKFLNSLIIPFATRQTQSYNLNTKIQDFDLLLKYRIASKNTNYKLISNFSVVYLDQFEKYKQNYALMHNQWSTWHFNSIVNKPRIVTEPNENQVCQLKFQGTNSYSEAGLRAITPFQKKYSDQNITAIQIKLKGNLSIKNKLFIRLYKKDGEIFQHEFSAEETRLFFNGQWNNLILPNRKSFWKIYSEDHHTLTQTTFDFTNIKTLLIAVISHDQQPHTLYFDDLSLIQKK